MGRDEVAESGAGKVADWRSGADSNAPGDIRSWTPFPFPRQRNGAFCTWSSV